MERVTVRMARSDRRTPWGFGVTEAPDSNVVIVNVVGGSLADRAGLRNGDIVDKLEDLDNLDINAVDRLLVTAHEKIELVVTRSSSSGPARIWRPDVTENTGAGQDERPYKVNLQHSNDSRPPQGFNSSALPFETDSRVKHMQYNSPLGLYSDKSAAEQYAQQTQGFVESNGAHAAASGREEPAYLRSETLRLLKEQERNAAPQTLSNHPNPSGLPVCFICTRPILGVMARVAGRDLHGDCLSCATCGNSLRNVGHHFIEDKFYCDIHGSQRKAGGRPGMDPNIFVKSSPTAAQPVHQHESPRAAYHPQINTARPLSVSPAPSGLVGGKQVTTHYHTPKTQGILSPAQRGVPNAAFGADLQKTVNYGYGAGGTQYDGNANSRLSPAPSQFSGISSNQQYQSQQQQQVRSHQISQAPPPVPSNAPPSNLESRVPSSVRSAVSPRRSGKTPRQWPPPAGPMPNRFWQIDAADALKRDKPNYGEDLAAMIKECEKEKEPTVVRKEPTMKNVRMNRSGRRASNISKEQVQQAFEEHRKMISKSEEETVPNAEVIEARKQAEQLKVEIEQFQAVESKVYQSPRPNDVAEISKVEPKTKLQAPEIKDGKIHWTVIHSPTSINTPPHSPAKVSSEAVIPRQDIVKPIAQIGTPSSYIVKDPSFISKTAIPKPFKANQNNDEVAIGRPLYSSVGLKESRIKPKDDGFVKSYIVKNSDANITTSTNLQTTVTRQYKTEEESLPKNYLQDFPSVQRTQQEPKETKLPERPTNLGPAYAAFLQAPNQAHETMDSSTSPIPTIRLSRKHETTVNTKPLNIPKVSITDIGTSPIKIPELSKIETPPRTPPVRPSLEVKKDPKHFKKVDFSMVSPVIINDKWIDNADIVDESDILTEASEVREEDSVSIGMPSSKYLNLRANSNSNSQPYYDGDESEMIDNKSDVTSTFDYDEVEVEVVEEDEDDGDEEDETTWNQEDIQNQNQRKKIRVVGKPQAAAQNSESQNLWRQRAMELLEDDAQTERDLMIVAALNERLQGLKEMEDDDRLKAIECIARHQSELEQTQTQLSSLLESAIVYLQNLHADDPRALEELGIDKTVELPKLAEQRVNELRQKLKEEEAISEFSNRVTEAIAPPIPPERHIFPFGRYPDIQERQNESPVTKSLHDVLDEFNSLSRPSPSFQPQNQQQSALRSSDAVEDSRNFLATRLGQCMTLEDGRQQKLRQGSSRPTSSSNGSSQHTKTTFERTTTETRPHDHSAGNQAGRYGTGEIRGAGSITTTTSQQNGGRIPYCEACKQQIRGAFVLATGKSWCPEHFVCANAGCRRRLLECGFVEEDGHKFCETCFEQNIAPRCAKCSKPIVSDCLNALQKKWHPTCFTCAHCAKPFGNSAFYLEKGLPYCEQDWNSLFTTKCVGCSYPIEAGDRWVEALGSAFHSNCFTCARCNHNLEGESFFAKNGQPFCKLHA